MRPIIARLLFLLVATAAACARNRAPEVAARPSATERPAALPETPALACRDCAVLPVSSDLAVAITARIADLKARGGECEEFGAVLERALASGLITLRPYMWRVEGNLASAQGESSGEMTIALDIDSLNVGVRRLDDVLRSAEHEAVHIALRIPSGDAAREAQVDRRVDECRMPPRHGLRSDQLR